MMARQEQAHVRRPRQPDLHTTPTRPASTLRRSVGRMARSARIAATPIGDTITGLKGKAHRPGLYQCNECREQFTVTVGTVFERSKIPLNKWLLATLPACASSKKGMSAHQLHRMLGVTYKTAWFMAHRIREAMTRRQALGPLGGEGKIVEADETYFGKPRASTLATAQGPPYIGKARPVGKRTVVALVERGGQVRSFHVADADRQDRAPDRRAQNVAARRRLHTDESRLYIKRRQGVRRARDRQPQPPSEYAPRATSTHQHGRRLLLDLQARHERRLSALRREAPAPLPRRVRFPLQQPHRARRRRQPSAPTKRSRASTASASPIGGLMKPRHA